jgi:Tfp pilus assembly protein PilF
VIRAGAIATMTFVLGGLGAAPIQCKHDPDPSLRMEDTAGDALWALAADFRKKGNEQAAKDTLRFLVDHYPSNRHAEEARAELAGK